VWPLPKSVEFDEAATVAEVFERIHVAAVARRDPDIEFEVARAVRELLPEVLMALLQAGARAGLPPPKEKERSPESQPPGIAGAFE
jgi:hypothetical protein